jgi:hypothetical protein
MFDTIGTIENYNKVPSPVLDETQAQGYRVEERLQVAIKAASNERTYTVEFRLGDDSQAPSEQQLNTWMDGSELVQAYCSAITARPFVHQEGKQYQARGSKKEINGAEAILDTFIVFAGVSMAALEDTSPLAAVVKQVRGDFKRSQRAYRAQRNAEKALEQQAKLEERARQLLDRKAQQDAEKATPEAVGAGTGRTSRK